MLEPYWTCILQPDLGTSLVYIAIFVGMLFISGIKTRLIKNHRGHWFIIDAL